MNQTDSLENMHPENTSNVENLNVVPKNSLENKSSKKKIIIIITYVILILTIVALILYIVLARKPDPPVPVPEPTDTVSDSFSYDISDYPSDSTYDIQISDSATDVNSTSTIPSVIISIPIDTYSDFSSESI